MKLVLVTGGARSGKSRYAQRRATADGGTDVTVVATALPVDEEMVARIAHHRSTRPAAWTTVEAPANAGTAIRAAATVTVLLDCLTVLSGNALGRARPATRDAALVAIRREVDAILSAVAERDGMLIVVTNEVGSSVHPPTELGRWFQDGLGEANQLLAAAATEVVLVVCGVAIRLVPPPDA
jgi:adenosylcobinamide kinase/adenosylcobinamide-phosphate guanylyltransferase